MEFDSPNEVDMALVAEQAKAQIQQMKETAEAVTKDLGLPEERKYDVLSVIYGGAKAAWEQEQRAAQEQEGKGSR